MIYLWLIDIFDESLTDNNLKNICTYCILVLYSIVLLHLRYLVGNVKCLEIYLQVNILIY